jgi:hypothetical protein
VEGSGPTEREWLSRGQFDDQLGLNRQRDIIDVRETKDASFGSIAAGDAEEVRDGGMAFLELRLDEAKAFGTSLDRDEIACMDEVAGNGDFFAVDPDVTVTDKLPGLGTRAGEAETMNNIIEATFEEAHQGVSGIPDRAVGNREITAELAFVEAVVTLDLLLFSQTERIVRGFAALGGVHPRGVFLAFERALGRIATEALEKELDAFTTAKPTYRTSVTSHI